MKVIFGIFNFRIIWELHDLGTQNSACLSKYTFLTCTLTLLWYGCPSYHLIRNILDKRPVEKYNRKRAKKMKLYFHINEKSSKDSWSLNSPQSGHHKALACTTVSEMRLKWELLKQSLWCYWFTGREHWWAMSMKEAGGKFKCSWSRRQCRY